MVTRDDIERSIASVLEHTGVRATKLQCHSWDALRAVLSPEILENVTEGGTITTLCGLAVEFDPDINPEYVLVR